MSLDEIKVEIIRKFKKINGKNEEEIEFLLDKLDESYHLGFDEGDDQGYQNCLKENDWNNTEDYELELESAYENGYSDGASETRSEMENDAEYHYKKGYNDAEREVEVESGNKYTYAKR